MDEGATQESSKRALNILAKQFSYLQGQYGETFEEFSRVCAKADEELEKLVAGTVFVRELRYLSCMLCDSYVRLCEEFSV